MFLTSVTIGTFLVIMAAVIFLGMIFARLSYDPVRTRLESLSTKAESGREPHFLVEGLAQQLPQTNQDNGKLDRELKRAGYYKPTSRVLFLALRNGLVLLVLIVFGIIAVCLGPDRLRLLLQLSAPAVAIAGMAWALPRLLLHRRATKRVRRINNGLPLALDMVTMSLSGGLSLQDALFHVSREIVYIYPDLAVELMIVRQQAELSSLDVAFDQLSQRVDAPEVTSMATLIAQGQRLGTDVVTSIQEFADGMRERRRQIADAKSSRAAVQMLMPMTLLLVPAVMLILWGPSMLELYEFLRDFEGPAVMP